MPASDFEKVNSSKVAPAANMGSAARVAGSDDTGTWKIFRSGRRDGREQDQHARANQHATAVVGQAAPAVRDMS